MTATHPRPTTPMPDGESPPGGHGQEVAKPHILLAEDNEANVTTLADYLDATGYQVGVARDGTEAISMTLSKLPDLIVMDIQMPKMNGLEATTRLRSINALEDLPIIALTALAMPGDRERCLDADACDYLSKPVRL